MLEQILRKGYSFWILIFISILLIVFRVTHKEKQELTWDIFGYYLPLQATVIHDDYMLDNRLWVEEVVYSNELAGTPYFISSNQEGESMYFFLFGMSYVYSPFFFTGHWIAGVFGFPQDGLSPPYQWSLIIGMLIFTIIGLIYLRKILKLYFDDVIVSILLILITIGTNYSHHMSLKNLETVNVLFTLLAIVVWNTIQWYTTYKFKNILFVALAIVLMALIKPSEVLIIILPLIWGVSNWNTFKNRIALLWNYRSQVILAILIAALLTVPQIAYWLTKTGKIYYDTYKNPGVGLDVFSPHILDSLFSYRKGWLVYTPIMFFSLIGFYHLFKRNRELFIGIIVPFLISFYIITSWTEYWYGAGFSNRPMITQYVLLAIPLGYFIQWLFDQRLFIKLSTFSIIATFVFLNQFQWWQLRNYILDPYRTTKAYYWKTFLKTSVSDEDRKLLLVERSFDAEQVFKNRGDYYAKTILSEDDISKFLESDSGFVEWGYTNHIPFKDITSKDHCWIQYIFEYKTDENTKATWCTMMERKEGAYSPKYFDLKPSQEWIQFEAFYLTPEIRSKNDVLKFFLWNQNEMPIQIKNLKVKVYQKKMTL